VVEVVRWVMRWIWVLGLLFWTTLTHAGAEIESLRLERRDNDLVFSASLKLELGGAVEDAVSKGVPLHFVAQAELVRDRWYWYDQRLAQVNRYYRLAYQPFTRQWRLQVASEPIVATGASATLAQNFDSLQLALDSVRQQSGWRLTEIASLQTNARYHVNYQFRLDLTQLPRAFQIEAGSQSDWNLELTRMHRFSLDARP